MANKQIEDFPLVATPEVTDIVHLSRAGVDRSISVVDLVPSVGSFGSVVIDTFVDTIDWVPGVSNTVNLTQSLISKDNAWVFFDGVYQEKDTYEVSGQLLSFNVAIPLGVTKIEVVVPIVLPVGQTDAINVQLSNGVTVADLFNAVIEFTDTDATPSVLGASKFLTTGTTNITNFDDGFLGQTIKIKARNNIIIENSASILLAGAVNFSMTANDTLTLSMYELGVWTEDSRSVN